MNLFNFLECFLLVKFGYSVNLALHLIFPSVYTFWRECLCGLRVLCLGLLSIRIVNTPDLIFSNLKLFVYFILF